MVDITVQLFLVPPFFSSVFFPAWVVCPVSVVACRLLPYPVCIFCLKISQGFSVTIAAVCCQHGLHTHRQPNLSGIILMAANCHADRNFDFQTVLLWKQFDIKLSVILVIVCQRYENTFPFFLYGNINPMIS